MFILKHQDGDVEYLFERGGFVIEGRELFLSIETKAVKDDAFPERFLLALRVHPFADEMQLTAEVKADKETEFPEVFVYTTFHAAEVSARVSVVFASQDEASITVSVMSDDVNYYDERAKPNLFTGTVQLHAAQKDDLWLPS